MKPRDNIHQVIGRSSTTFSNSTRFFPREIRDDVKVLYAFVRAADDFVDNVPPDPHGFFAFRRAYAQSRAGVSSGEPAIEAFVELSSRRNFDPAWVDSFLDAMEQDLSKRQYSNLEETLAYVYGSAEVVGLMMARVMGLPDESLPYARLLGRAFQYINFVRDIDEDLQLGRVYLPADAISAAGLTSLDRTNAARQRPEFEEFVRGQIGLYRRWREESAAGYRYIPRRFLIAIKTAADIYDHTADVIWRDPLIVFRRKVKPRRCRVIATGLRNILMLPRRPL